LFWRGFGLSTPNPNGSLLSFAEDIDEIADILALNEFGIIGYSAGGPYALASLFKSRLRIFGSAIVSSIAPRENFNNDRFSFTKSMSTPFKIAWWISDNAQWLIKLLKNFNLKLGVSETTQAMENIWRFHAEIDQESYKRNSIIQDLFLKSELETSSRCQNESKMNEWILFASNWGFELKDIDCDNVSVYHGALDKGTTIEMGEYIHHQIPNSRKRFYKDKGHLLIFDIWDQILELMIEDSKINNATTINKCSNE